jgi:hypothetical protein
MIAHDSTPKKAAPIENRKRKTMFLNGLDTIVGRFDLPVSGLPFSFVSSFAFVQDSLSPSKAQ